MNLEQIVCYIKSRGKHVESSRHDGDHHCISCGRYLYTLYDFKGSLRAMRNASKMWWEIPE